MIPLFTFTLPVLLLFVGLVVDVGQLELTKLKMQNAADAAALGAQVAHDAEDLTWVAQGVSDAKLNGFDVGDTINATTVVISEEPYAELPDAFYSGYYDVAQARITQNEFTFFIGLFSSGNFTVSASAAAKFSTCSYFMSTGTVSNGVPYSLYLGGGGSLGYAPGTAQANNQLGCSVYVGKSLQMNGGALWTNATNIVGSGSGSIYNNYLHPPRFNAANVTDPLAYISQPNPGGCTATGTLIINLFATTTLNPGTYCALIPCVTPINLGLTIIEPFPICGGLTIVDSRVNLNPGLYVIEGGAYFSGASLTSSGGVTFYFTKANTFLPLFNPYGTFLTNNSNINISAPTSSSNGAIPGVLFMNDRNWSPSSAQDFQFINTLLINLFGYTNCNSGDGIFYLTNAGLNVSNCNFSGVNYLGFDVDNMVIQGSNVAPKSNFTGLGGGSPFPQSAGVVQ